MTKTIKVERNGVEWECEITKSYTQILDYYSGKHEKFRVIKAKSEV